MSDVFNPQRFARLFRAHFAEHRREYFWFVVIAAMIDIVFVAFTFFSELHTSRQFSEFQQNGQMPQFMMGLFATGFIFAGRYFKELGQPGSALILMMRPASIFEKFLLALLVVGVLFPFAYSIVYTALNYPIVQLASALYVAPKQCDTCQVAQIANFSMFVPFRVTTEATVAGVIPVDLLGIQLFFFLMLAIMQGVVLGGTVFFKRAGLLWTCLICFVLAIVTIGFGVTPHAEVFMQAQRSHGAIAYNDLEKSLAIFMWAGILVLTWMAVYFHIKEREVA